MVEIADSLHRGEVFLCHTTIDYAEVEQGAGDGQDRARACAGARATHRRDGRLSQIEQVSERLGFTIPELATQAPVHDGLEAWVEAMSNVNRAAAEPENTG